MPGKHNQGPAEIPEDGKREYELAEDVDPEKFYWGFPNDGHGHRTKIECNLSPVMVQIMYLICEHHPKFQALPKIGRLTAFQRNAYWQVIGRYYPQITDPKARAQLDKLFLMEAEQVNQAFEMQKLADSAAHYDRTKGYLEVMEKSGKWMNISRAITAGDKILDSGEMWEPHAGDLRNLLDQYRKKLQEAGDDG